MAYQVTNQYGPYNSYESQYTSSNAGGLFGSVPAAPVRGAYSSGGIFSMPKINFTSTTDAQNAPSAPFQVRVKREEDKYSELYNQGDILWGVYSFSATRDKNDVIRARSLWHLNMDLDYGHREWVKTFENCTSVEDCEDVMKWYLKRDDFRFKVDNTDNSDVSDMDFFELLELSNTTRIGKFLKQYPYIGPTIDPNGTSITEGNLMANTTGVKLFLCEAEGRVKMPNIFRATMPGTEVGFMITKFTNPHALAADSDSDWRTILHALAPIQVWPVANFNRRFPTCGMYNGGCGQGGPIPLPPCVGESSWNERDPTKIQQCHWDYHASAWRPNAHSSKVLDTKLVMRTSYYMAIGTVDTTVPGKPSVEEVCAAVAPKLTRYDPNTAWNRLMDKYPITVHCRTPSHDMIQQIDQTNPLW